METTVAPDDFTTSFTFSVDDSGNEIPTAVITIGIIAVAFIIGIAVAKFFEYIYTRNSIRDDVSDMSEYTKNILKMQFMLAFAKKMENAKESPADLARRYAKMWRAKTAAWKEKNKETQSKDRATVEQVNEVNPPNKTKSDPKTTSKTEKTNPTNKADDKTTLKISVRDSTSQKMDTASSKEKAAPQKASTDKKTSQPQTVRSDSEVFPSENKTDSNVSKASKISGTSPSQVLPTSRATPASMSNVKLEETTNKSQGAPTRGKSATGNRKGVTQKGISSTVTPGLVRPKSAKPRPSSVRSVRSVKSTQNAQKI